MPVPDRTGAGGSRTPIWPIAVITTAMALAACVPPADPDPGYRELTYAEQALVERAEGVLTKQCMEKEGFRYWIGPIVSTAERQGGGYVLSDLAWARKYGYGTELDEQANKDRLADPNVAYAGKLSRPELIRYNTALDGSPENGWVSVDLPGGGTVQTTAGGCRARALDRLYGDFRAWFHANKTAESLKPLYAPAIVKDTRFERALTAWAACMNKAGHPYADPPSIRRDLVRLTQGLSRAEARATEVELAVTEATCATDTPLLRTARALEREYRAEKLGSYRDEIADQRRMSLTALANAKDLMGAKALTGPDNQHKNR